MRSEDPERAGFRPGNLKARAVVGPDQKMTYSNQVSWPGAAAEIDSPVMDCKEQARLLSLARQMAGRFPRCAGLRAVDPLGNGLINATFAVQAPAGATVLQRINSAVFADPSLIVANIARLQQAVAESQDPAAPRMPRLFRSDTGGYTARDPQGAAWRLMELIPEARALAEVATRAQAADIGRVLARFHRFGARQAVADYALTLASLHDTPAYRADLEDLVHRAALDADASAAFQAIQARDPDHAVLHQAVQSGALAKTLVHGDPKRDNILFDKNGVRALCLIDLDTLQPGLILHDIADCLRSCCNRAGASAAGAAVRFDLPLAEALLQGYVREAPDLLSATEADLLFDAIRLIPLELGMRFLADHLRGDRYFRVRYAGENLGKALGQLALVADIERQEKPLRSMIGALTGR